MSFYGYNYDFTADNNGKIINYQIFFGIEEDGKIYKISLPQSMNSNIRLFKFNPEIFEFELSEFIKWDANTVTFTVKENDQTKKMTCEVNVIFKSIIMTWKQLEIICHMDEFENNVLFEGIVTCIKGTEDNDHKNTLIKFSKLIIQEILAREQSEIEVLKLGDVSIAKEKLDSMEDIWMDLICEYNEDEEFQDIILNELYVMRRLYWGFVVLIENKNFEKYARMLVEYTSFLDKDLFDKIETVLRENLKDLLADDYFDSEDCISKEELKDIEKEIERKIEFLKTLVTS